MREQFRSITTNFTPVRVVGIPGLVLVLIAIALAVQFPEARWLLLGGLGGGLLLAAGLVIRRARRAADDDDDRRHGILMVGDPPSTRPEGSRRGSDSRSARQRRLVTLTAAAR